MRKLLKPANISFYFLMFIIFFFIGIYAAGFVEAGKNQMLAGGAIVFGWGVIFAAIGFVGSFFIVWYSIHKTIIKLNWVLLILIIVAFGVTHCRYLERQKEKGKNKPSLGNPKKVTGSVIALPKIFSVPKK